ncbi:MAG: DUF4363 family protein [Oscillospiraceae bacterium]|nr:DUF4363 family protein [Oscillospiraceae bacterium]
MRKCIVAALIIAFVISLCIYTAGFTSDFCTELETEITLCINNIEKERWNDAETNINSSIALMNTKEHIFETFIMHHDLDEIRSLIHKTSAAIRARYRQTALSEAEYLLARIKLISSADKLTLSNIL